MKKLAIILLLIWITGIQSVYSQLNYHFNSGTRTYQTITTGTTVSLTSFFPASSSISPTDEGFVNNIPIGFSFLYNNTQQINTIKVCTDGFIVLGEDFKDGSVNSQDGYYINNLTQGPSSFTTDGLNKSGHSNQRGVLAPFWGDLDVQQNSNLVYQTTGTAPNRVFTIEWKNIKWDYQCNAAVGSFQIKLYESSNIIEFDYLNQHGTPTNNAKASIGISNKTIGLGNFYSVQSTDVNTTASRFSENNTITSFPASNTVYQFIPQSIAANNLSVTALYHPGTVCKNGESYTFSANIYNAGSATANHIPITMAVKGNNTFSSVQYIDNLSPGSFTTVSFDAFVPNIICTDSLIVSLPNDGDNTDNQLQDAVRITSNMVNNLSLEYNNQFLQQGIGNNTPSEFAAKFSTTNFKSINQINLYFSNESNNAPFNIAVYAADGINNNPGTLLWQQQNLISSPGNMNINITPGITVQGTYYVAVTQSSTTNISYAYEIQSPLQPNTYYYRTPLNSSWIDISTENNPYKLAMGVVYDNTLPVSATKFTGYKTGDKNSLRWTTYTEINNDHFELERSTNGHDFVSVAKINSKAPTGNSTTAIYYDYTDENTPAVNTYYRLRQVDKQAIFALSDVVMLQGTGKLSLSLNKIFPNPVESLVKIEFTSPVAGNNSLLLFDMAGRLIKRNEINSIVGDNQLQLNLTGLIKGQYVLLLLNNTGKSNLVMLMKN